MLGSGGGGGGEVFPGVGGEFAEAFDDADVFVGVGGGEGGAEGAAAPAEHGFAVVGEVLGVGVDDFQGDGGAFGGGRVGRAGGVAEEVAGLGQGDDVGEVDVEGALAGVFEDEDLAAVFAVEDEEAEGGAGDFDGVGGEPDEGEGEFFPEFAEAGGGVAFAGDEVFVDGGSDLGREA